MLRFNGFNDKIQVKNRNSIFIKTIIHEFILRNPLTCHSKEN